MREFLSGLLLRLGGSDGYLQTKSFVYDAAKTIVFPVRVSLNVSVRR